METTSPSQREQRLLLTSTGIFRSIRGSSRPKLRMNRRRLPRRASHRLLRPCRNPGNGSDVALSAIEIKSTPDGAEITVDDKYMGSTPSTLRLSADDHKIRLDKPGFLTVSGGGTVRLMPRLKRSR